MLLLPLPCVACPSHPHSALSKSFKRQPNLCSISWASQIQPTAVLLCPCTTLLTSAVDIASDTFLFLLCSCISTPTAIEDEIFYLYLPLYLGWCLWFDRYSQCLSSSWLIDWLNEQVTECDIFWNWVFVFFCSIGRSNKASNWKQRKWYGC